MILEALINYYDAEIQDEETDIPPYGFFRSPIHYIIVLDKDGVPIRIDTTVQKSEKGKDIYKTYPLPTTERSSDIKSKILWDNCAYTLGATPYDEKGNLVKEGGKEVKRRLEAHSAFKKHIDKLSSLYPCDQIKALHAFMEREDKLQLLSDLDNYKSMLVKKNNITFKLSGDTDPMPCNAIFHPYMIEEFELNNCGRGLCTVTGKQDLICNFHMKIKGVKKSQSSGASLISYDNPSSCVHGKEGGLNGPVGMVPMFKYVSALNHLLRFESKQKLTLGNNEMVFWSSDKLLEKAVKESVSGSGRNDGDEPKLKPKPKPGRLKDKVKTPSMPAPKDISPSSGMEHVAELLKAFNKDQYLLKKDIPFHLLGLAAPSGGRVTVRFWSETSVADMTINITQHFNDIAIDRPKWKGEHLNVYQLLVQVAIDGKNGPEIDKLPESLVAGTLRAVFNGTLYPPQLVFLTAQRMGKKREVTYEMASFIKAIINRRTRYQNPDMKEEITMSLNVDNNNVSYLFGRLFAVVAKAQKESAHGEEINKTVVDKYFAKASENPVTVIGPVLEKLPHYLSNLKYRVRHEKTIGEIMDKLDVDNLPVFPPQEDRLRFALGFYQQTQDYYKTSEKEPNDHPDTNVDADVAVAAENE